MLNKKFDFIILVLVYRNIVDLEEFILSSKIILNKKIIVINAYYDEKTKIQVEKIANKYDCDFLNINNLGYSCGNNMGIKYAIEHYEFKYLIISNPDIIIKEFPISVNDLKADIIAPKIIAKNGKYQNPMMVKEDKKVEFLMYLGCKRNNKLLYLFGVGINKIKREIFLLKHKNKEKDIYMAHGSFILISAHTLKLLENKPYDENMFLFVEEFVLAYKSNKKGIVTRYLPDIVVNHKEDGSIDLEKISVYSELSKSHIYYHEKYRKK